MTRQGKILLGCLIVLAMTLVYNYLQSPQQQRVERADQERATDPKIVSGTDTGGMGRILPRLSLDADDRKDLAWDRIRPQRDLFAPLYAVESAPPPSSSAVPAPVFEPSPPATSNDVPAETRANERLIEPEPVTAHFNVLGYLEVEGQRVVFLETGEETFLARPGASFGDRFRVIELTDDRLVIAQKGASRPITLTFDEAPGVSHLGGTPSSSERGRNVVPESRRFR